MLSALATLTGGAQAIDRCRKIIGCESLKPAPLEMGYYSRILLLSDFPAGRTYQIQISEPARSEADLPYSHRKRYQHSALTQKPKGFIHRGAADMKSIFLQCLSDLHDGECATPRHCLVQYTPAFAGVTQTVSLQKACQPVAGLL